jgi:putative membrane protein
MKSSLLFALFLGLSTAVLAEGTPSANTTPATAQTANVQLKEPQIAKVLLAINDGEIDSAKMAMHRAKNDEVKKFARDMMDQHKANMKDTRALVKNEKIRPQESELCKSVIEDAKTANKQLRSADKASFDKSYVDEQVDMHQKALETLNNTLIPNASDAQFKAHLEKTRDAVNMHLAHAKDLQTRLR